MHEITIIGGGVAGLTAAITCAEAGAPVRLLEAHEALGGRARSTDGDYKANLGPHAVYKGGTLWQWLAQRKLLPPMARPRLTGIRFHYDGTIHKSPPLALIPPGLRLRGHAAPVEQDFRSWAADNSDERTAAMLSSAAGVFTFHHDPGELSAAFVWERSQRLLLNPALPARFVVGGWVSLVDALASRARSLGVRVQLGRRAESLGDGPTIVALELRDARKLLDDQALTGLSGRVVCLDLGMRARAGDPWVVSDLQSSGWIELYSAQDRTLAPDGESLIQAQMPIRPSESTDAAEARLKRILGLAFEDDGGRVTWRRRQVMDGRSGALDPPGATWRERPAIARGDDVFLCGDQVAAPGCLAEVSFASAIEAGALAVLSASRSAIAVP